MYSKNLIATLTDLEAPLPAERRAMLKKLARQQFDMFMYFMYRQDVNLNDLEQFIQQYQNPAERVIREEAERFIPNASDALDYLIKLGKIKFGRNSRDERTVSLVTSVEQNRFFAFKQENGTPYVAVA